MANICKLCDSASQLQKSHAIPDSIFRRIFRANSGKAILLKTGAGDIQYTNDSLATPQLCSKCERLINENYEKYSIDILRGGRGSASETSNGITFSGIDVNKLRMFFIAIFWRAANSTHTTYSGTVMPVEFYHKDVNKILKKAILTNTPVPSSTISIKIQRLVDRSGGFDMKILKSIIITPFHRPYGAQKNVSVCFVMEGFLITLIMPGLSFAARKHESLINRNSNIVVAEFFDIFDDQVLKDALLIFYDKAITGQSKIQKS